VRSYVIKVATQYFWLAPTWNSHAVGLSWRKGYYVTISNSGGGYCVTISHRCRDWVWTNNASVLFENQTYQWYHGRLQNCCIWVRKTWKIGNPNNSLGLEIDCAFVCEAATLLILLLRTHTSGAQYWGDREVPCTNRMARRHSCKTHGTNHVRIYRGVCLCSRQASLSRLGGPGRKSNLIIKPSEEGGPGAPWIPRL